MNEALVDACLKVARLTRALAEARAEMLALREADSAVRATKMVGEQVKTATEPLEQGPGRLTTGRL